MISIPPSASKTPFSVIIRRGNPLWLPCERAGTGACPYTIDNTIDNRLQRERGHHHAPLGDIAYSASEVSMFLSSIARISSRSGCPTRIRILSDSAAFMSSPSRSVTMP